LGRSRVIKVALSIAIRDWLESVVVCPALLYRRLRYGYAFRRIRMSLPRYAKVNPADYKKLRKYEWLVRKGTNSSYAYRRLRRGKGKKSSLIYMHQEIIDVPAGMVIDHINYDGMDNRSKNLRAATLAQNICHRKKRSGAKHSKYKGLCWKKKDRRWETRIGLGKKQIHIGSYRSEIDAAKAYDTAAIKYHGQFASLNFPKPRVGRWQRWFRIWSA